MMNTNVTPRLPNTLAILALFIGLPSTVTALPDDNQQPINIQSDRATQKTLEGSEKTEYFGNVVMTQGSLQINGDHVVIHSTDRKVTHITATGTPARFQQQSDPAKDPVKARANTIDYKLTTEIVILADNANIEQEGAVVSGNRIEYNVASEQVQAEDRVNMVFTPANDSSEQAGNDTTTNNNKGSDVGTDSQ